MQIVQTPYRKTTSDTVVEAYESLQENSFFRIEWILFDIFVIVALYFL